ncbi:MAG: hypothetical protein J0H89_10700 [Rhizobiales bacterium]|nr:hypothetical protein [Hyphomicrobiales bacterium]
MSGERDFGGIHQGLRLVAVLTAFGLLTGCGVKGDFGRMRPSLAGDDVHAWLGPAALGGKRNQGSAFQLTEEERRLRDLAYPLIDPPYDRNKWDSVLGELGYVRHERTYPKRSEYATRLLTTPYRSQTARYNRLIEDIRADVTRLDPFYATARYVLDMDGKREKSLSYMSNLAKYDRANALQRIAENRAIVQWVEGSVQERLAAYKLALERMVVTAPSPLAVEAERALTLLSQSISAYTA